MQIASPHVSHERPLWPDTGHVRERFGTMERESAISPPPAVILAGGEGRRIGGDKALRLLGGRPLVSHVIERVAPQVSGLAINAPGGAALVTLGLPLLPDPAGGLGPLAGISAALHWARGLGADKVLTVAVDTPFLPADLVTRLCSGGSDAAYAVTDDGPHATTGLWPVSLAGDLDGALADGVRKVRDWTRTIGAVAVRFPDAAAFFNVNTPEDLKAAEARLSG